MFYKRVSIQYPRTYPLGALPLKTLDTGIDGVHVSANAYGNILQINSTHSFHGVIAATAFKPFSGDFCAQNDVKDYHRILLSDEKLETACGGYGVILQNLRPVGDVTLEHISGKESHDWKAVRSVYQCKSNITVINTLAVTTGGEVRQTRHITTTAETPLEVQWKLFGITEDGSNQCHISRASYGQLTEAGRIPFPAVKRSAWENVSQFGVKSVFIDGKETFGKLQGVVQIGDERGARESSLPQAPLSTMHSEQLTKTSPVMITARYQLRQGLQIQELHEPLSAKWHRFVTKLTSSDNIDIADYFVWRNVDYILDNCCIGVPAKSNAVDPVCVITDHVALPLGWNRDNYWQLRLLMELREASKEPVAERWDKWYSPEAYEDRIDKVLFGHLNWVFRQAALHSTKIGEELEVYIKEGDYSHPGKREATRNRAGFWARSYIINGNTKDSSGVFQLDQQCYPFLELCDFWKTYDTLNPQSRQRESAKKLVCGILAEPRAKSVLQLLIAEIGELGLINTDKTPADDQVKYGNLFSNNLLVWYTFTRLHKLFGELCIQNDDLKSLKLDQKATAIRAAMNIYKTYTLLGGSQKRVFAYDYGYDEHNKAELAKNEKQNGVQARPVRCIIQADGNDVPTLMASEWGFLSDSDANRDPNSTTYSDREVWQNTMDWMFDPVANKAVEQAYEGSYWSEDGNEIMGLGSDHSPKPWPLGMYQEWVYFTSRGNHERAANAWSRIRLISQWDGTFSETVDMVTGACDSKAWFSWPGAMIARAIIQMSRFTSLVAERENKTER